VVNHIAAAVFFYVMLSLGAAPAPAAGTRYARARYWLLNWHLGPAYLDSCAAVLAPAVGCGAEREERLELRARLLMVKGDRESSPASRAGWYASARAAAETLRALNERNPSGHVWWAVAQGRILELQGMVAAARGAAAVRRENERALELDRDCALAGFALGRMYEALPGLLGGGAKKAEVRYRRALASDSNYTIIRLALARVLVRLGRCEEARAELGRLLATASPSNPAEAALEDRPTATALLDSLGGSEPARAGN